MSRKNDGNNFSSIRRVGNYTKHAVENFEENIVTQKNYLEKVKNNEKNKDVE